MALSKIYTDSELLEAVSAFDETNNILPRGYLRPMFIDHGRYFCLDTKQRQTLEKIVEKHEIDLKEYV